MAEETKFKIWQVVQSVIAALLVFAISHLSTTLGGLTENVIRHDEILKQLVAFGPQSGDRYTKDDGKKDRTARIEADVYLQRQIDDISHIIEKVLDDTQEHNSEANAYIEMIKQHRRDIQSLQSKSHTHNLSERGR